MSEIVDDADDKIRRNVVAFSSLVILGAWLGIPLAAVAEKLIATGYVEKVPQWRVWMAVLAILAYLLLRFRFSEETRKALQSMRTEWNVTLRAKVEALLRRGVARFSKSGRASPLFVDPLKEKLDVVNQEQAILSNRKPDELGKAKIELAKVVFASSGHAIEGTLFTRPYEGTAHFTFAWSHGGARAGGSGLRFAVVGWARFRVRAMSALHLLTYSVASLQVLLPLLLASVALLIASFKLCLAIIA